MKRVLIALMVLVLAGYSAIHSVKWSGNWGVHPLFNIGLRSPGGIEVVFSSYEMIVEDKEIDGVVMQSVGIPAVYIADPGVPHLGGVSRWLALPEGARAEVEILDVRTEVFHNVEIAPAPSIPRDDEDAPLKYEKNSGIYSKDAYWPKEPVVVGEKSDIRGVDVVLLSVVPFQYNPVTKDLIVYKDIRFRVNFVGGNGHFGVDRLRSRFWEPILQGNLLNYDQLPRIDFYSSERVQARDGWEYIIISPDDATFLAWADTLKRWRKLQGISCEVFTPTQMGGNDSAHIKAFLQNAYNTWNPAPVAFLVLSDFNPSGDVYGIPAARLVILGETVASDNWYADMNNDNLPDLHHGRIVAQTNAHLDSIIHKMLSVERNPTTNAHFYDYPIVAAAWQTERWFQMCGEVVRGFLMNGLGKPVERLYAIYSGTPTVGGPWSTRQGTMPTARYWYNLGWLPDTLNQHDATWWNNGNNTLITQAINNGAYFVQHRDHGSETGWGEPAYHNSDILNLTNGNSMFPYVNSSNCLTGKYIYSGECFTERFMRDTHGAVGVNAASEVSYSFVNDSYVWGIWDGLYPQFDPGYPNFDLVGYSNMRPCQAMTHGKFYLATTWFADSAGLGTGDYRRITYHLFHHHGDCFMTLNSVIPQNLTVSHPATLTAGATSFPVTANDSSVIALTVNGEIIGCAMGTGSVVNITIPPQTPGNTMIVTVTRFNYRRYSAEVPIVSSNYPYVTMGRDIINDSGGDGVINPGETVNWGVYGKNVGQGTAQQVYGLLSETSPYVTVSIDSSWYGNIPQNDSVLGNPYYRFVVANNTPNGHQINCTLDFHDVNDSIFHSYKTLTVYAPILTYQSVAVVGGNGNGILDPGETANLVVAIKNEGGATASSITGVLRESSPYITLNDSLGSWTDLAPGATGNNSSNPFVVTASSSTPPGTTIDFTIHITATNYSVDIQFSLVVGAPGVDYVTHDCGNCQFTVTRYGALGFMGSSQSGGVGFRYPGAGSNHLFYGSLAVGSSSSYCVDQYYESTNVDDDDWNTTTSPDGKCRMYEPWQNNIDEYATACYNDSGHPSPQGLLCDQYSWAWDDPTANDFVIMKFVLTNSGTSTLSNLNAAVFMDWDIGTYGSNYGNSEAARNLTYMYYNSSYPYVGVEILDPPRTTQAQNLALIDNQTYVYPYGGLPDNVQIQFMDGTIQNPSGGSANDWSTCNSSGPFNLAPGENKVVAFAVLGGTNLSDLQANADTAYNRYWYWTGVKEEEKRQMVRAQFSVYPVVTGGQLNFAYTGVGGEVRVAVYDVSGRMVAERVWQNLKGEGLVNIDLSKLASGVYFVRLEGGLIDAVEKIILLK